MVLADLLGLQALALEHVEEVRVAAEVELVGAVDADAAVAEEAGEDAVDDGGADLALDVVADDGDAGDAEAVGPVFLAGDEDGDAVDEGALGVEDLFDVPLGGFLAADGKVVDDDVDFAVLEDAGDVGGGAGGLGDDLTEVLAEAVVGHAALDGDVRGGDVGELHRVVGLDEDGLGEVLADLVGVDVEGGDEVEVVDVVVAQEGVHDAGDFLALGGVAVEVDALHERGGAVADPDDGDVDLAHGGTALLLAACAAGCPAGEGRGARARPAGRTAASSAM